MALCAMVHRLLSPEVASCSTTSSPSHLPQTLRQGAPSLRGLLAPTTSSRIQEQLQSPPRRPLPQLPHQTRTLNLWAGPFPEASTEVKQLMQAVEGLSAPGQRLLLTSNLLGIIKKNSLCGGRSGGSKLQNSIS